MSEWMVRKPYKMANGNFRPRVGNAFDERKTLKQFECSTEKEARKKALEWIIREENKSDENYIKDKNITIREFIDSYYRNWRSTYFVADSVAKFVRYLEHHNWLDTKLSSITTKWCIEFRRRIPDFKQKNGKNYKYKDLYKDLVCELTHLLQQAKYEELVVTNYNSRLTNPNKHLVEDEESEAIDRAFDREEKIWSKEQLNKFLPRFQNIPSSRIQTQKNSKEPRKPKMFDYVDFCYSNAMF